MSVKTIGSFNKSLLIQEQSPEISKEINRFLKNRPQRTRTGLYITDMTNPCLRRLVWKVLRPDIVDRPPAASMSRIYDAGTCAHDWWQNRYYGPMGILHGKWRCSMCRTLVEGAMPAAPCQNSIKVHPPDELYGVNDEYIPCDYGHWEYLEPRVKFEHDGLVTTGRADGIIFLSKEPHILEMKTRNTERWKETSKPDASHVLQGSLYAHLMNIDKIMISYIEKNTWSTKDFIIDRNPEALRWLVDQMSTLKMLLEKGDPMGAPGICPKKTASRAASCGARKFCFN